jgi:hypothetical protein
MLREKTTCFRTAKFVLQHVPRIYIYTPDDPVYVVFTISGLPYILRGIWVEHAQRACLRVKRRKYEADLKGLPREMDCIIVIGYC